MLRITAVLLLLVSEANAGFIDNYSRWREASVELKIGYVEALLDHATSVGSPDDAYYMANREGLIACSQALELNAGMLIEAVDKYYQDDPKHWGDSASGAFYGAVLFGVCGKHIAAARQKRGLNQVKP